MIEPIDSPLKAKAEHSSADDVVLCRASVELPSEINGELMYLPGGDHSISPFGGGIGKPINVRIDASAVTELERERDAIGARKAPYFDFNHKDDGASFWPTKFVWRDGDKPGIYAQGEWTAKGKEAVSGKEFRYFSPVFYVDNKHATPARIICRENAAPNMGGLTNDPAFHNILPLWAKNAGATSEPQPKDQPTMTAEEIAALQAKEVELQKEIDDLNKKLVAKQNAEDVDDEGIASVNAELRARESELKASRLQARIADQEALINKRSRADAEKEVKDAVLRGAIAAKDRKTQDDLIAKGTADPGFLTVIRAMQGNRAMNPQRITASDFGRASVTNEDPLRIFGSMAKILSHSKVAGRNEKIGFAREFASIYAAEFHGDNRERLLSFPVVEFNSAIQAADVTDGDLGTLAGVLVTQRVLELLKFSFPSLSAFTTDFSDQPATFGQTIICRTVTIPNVTSYNTSTGWAASTAATDDVPVAIDNHKGVQITFNEQTLASTVRRLFDEFAPAAAYALAKAVVDDLYSNITDANFTNNRVIATASFTRAIVASIETDLDLLGVPAGLGMRTMLLYPTVFEKLVTDAVIVQLAAYQKAELITNPTNGVALSIPVNSFNVIKAPNIPTNDGNVTGFAGSKSALLVATRTPNDYTSVLPGASFGNVQMVTDPDIGITVMLTQFVNHTLGNANSRIALMFGTAAGQGNAGELIKAATGSGSSRTS